MTTRINTNRIGPKPVPHDLQLKPRLAMRQQTAPKTTTAQPPNRLQSTHAASRPPLIAVRLDAKRDPLTPRPGEYGPPSERTNREGLEKVFKYQETIRRAAATTGRGGNVTVSPLLLASVVFSESQSYTPKDWAQSQELRRQMAFGSFSDNTLRQLTSTNRTEESYGPNQIQLRNVHQLLLEGRLKVPPEFQPAGGLKQGKAYADLTPQQQASMCAALVLGENSSIFVAAALLERDMTRFVKQGGDPRIGESGNSEKPGTIVVGLNVWLTGMPLGKTPNTRTLDYSTDVPSPAADGRFNMRRVGDAMNGNIRSFEGYHGDSP
jgi:hypothetical protein